METKQIVVGIDGSGASLAAAHWAARDAGRRKLPVHVVLAYEWAWHGAHFTAAPPAEKAARERAEEIVAAAAAEIQLALPQVVVTTEAVRGRPADALIKAGADAEEIVIGNRGAGGFANLLLGSVSQQVATHAPCPVVVVHDDADAHAGTGPVVVGVDGSAADETSVHLAFEAAKARGTSLVVVNAFTLPLVWGGYGITPEVYREPIFTEQPRKIVDAAAALWRDKYPDVPVETVVAPGRATDVLVGVSKKAQLVVVGTRGHGGFTGLLLGSVGLQLLHHSHSPVLIARR
jgi:nucleotide-binding universal stress UspA family protein